jgi:hypothetical protein
MSDVFIASEMMSSLVLHPEHSHAEISLCQMGTIYEIVQLSLTEDFQLVTSMKFREPSDIFYVGNNTVAQKIGTLSMPEESHRNTKRAQFSS